MKCDLITCRRGHSQNCLSTIPIINSKDGNDKNINNANRSNYNVHRQEIHCLGITVDRLQQKNK